MFSYLTIVYIVVVTKKATITRAKKENCCLSVTLNFVVTMFRLRLLMTMTIWFMTEL
jgi:hypothetical protein